MIRLLRPGWPIAATGLLLGLLVGLFIGLRWDAAVADPERFASFLGRFFTSAGIAGVAAILAALIAVFGVGKQIQSASSQTSRTLTHASKQAADSFAHSSSENTKTLEQASAATALANQQAREEAQSADWWKSFEWTTARIFATSDQGLQLDQQLGYTLADALRTRAEKPEQQAVCDALVTQIATTTKGTKESASVQRASANALSSYVSNPGRSRRRLTVAIENLVNMQVPAALDEIEATAGIKLAQGGAFDGMDTGFDASFTYEGHVYGVLVKVYATTTASNVRRILRNQAESSKHRFIAIVQATDDWPSGWDSLKNSPVIIVPPEITDIQAFLVEKLPMFLRYKLPFVERKWWTE